MKAVISLVNRNRKLFFRDKGMFFSALITPFILIVLYVTFLAKVYKDSFTSAFPEVFTIAEKLIDGTVASQLVAALLAVSCVTVTFCVNLTMVQDKASGARKDFNVSPETKCQRLFSTHTFHCMKKATVDFSTMAIKSFLFTFDFRQPHAQTGIGLTL